ncbi:unnamed protein product [Meganyctiphanes norvegica]|uniref:Odorant receptor n=1 Tax=Meganyctiphanes norvegica TaxID=48144 RepID=A0AAV2RKQ0_MEGNR
MTENGGNRTSTYNKFYDTNLEESKYNEESREESEPDLIRCNQEKISHFRRFGLFLVHWKKDKYEANEKRIFLYYLIWYIAIMACFSLVFGLKQIFKGQDYIDQVDDLVEASFVGVLLGIIPAFWIYLLREYSTHLPQILMMTKKFEKSEVYKKLAHSTECMSIISYEEGWKDRAYDDVDDEENFTLKAYKKQWWPVKYGPHIGFILSVSVCIILIILSFIVDISNIILNQPLCSLKRLKRELPFFIMTVLYPIPYFVSIWFCIFFLEWQRSIYETMRFLIRRIKNNISKNSDEDTSQIEKNKKELENIADALIKAQKVFLLLNKTMFQKTIGIAFTLFILMGIFCCWKVLQDPSNFAYCVPLSLIIGHIYLACSWSNSLIREYDETIEVLNDMPEDDVRKVINVLNKCSPQVLAFGGFKVNFSMMTAVLAFIISCIGIPEEMWPEDSQHCYQCDTGQGTWNDTLCIKRRLFINTNQTLCLRKKP